jgi:exosortase K
MVAVGLFILLKFGFRFATTDNLVFLLKPTDSLVGLLTGSPAVFLSGKGYYHESLNILVEKACSGFNLLLLCFIMLTFLILKYAGKRWHKILIIPSALVLSYFLTIFVNASRIFASVLVQKQAVIFFPPDTHFLLHETVGIIINLVFLVVIYLSINFFLTHRQNHAKFAEP